MRAGSEGTKPSEYWEKLYRQALCEADNSKLPRRIEVAKHAILDRLEDTICVRTKSNVHAGEMAALRNAHRALRVLEQTYFSESTGKMIA